VANSGKNSPAAQTGIRENPSIWKMNGARVTVQAHHSEAGGPIAERGRKDEKVLSKFAQNLRPDLFHRLGSDQDGLHKFQFLLSAESSYHYLMNQ